MPTLMFIYAIIFSHEIWKNDLDKPKLKEFFAWLHLKATHISFGNWWTCSNWSQFHQPTGKRHKCALSTKFGAKDALQIHQQYCAKVCQCKELEVSPNWELYAVLQQGQHKPTGTKAPYNVHEIDKCTWPRRPWPCWALWWWRRCHQLDGIDEECRGEYLGEDIRSDLTLNRAINSRWPPENDPFRDRQ
jgi:hypothetical protein